MRRRQQRWRKGFAGCGCGEKKPLRESTECGNWEVQTICAREEVRSAWVEAVRREKQESGCHLRPWITAGLGPGAVDYEGSCRRRKSRPGMSVPLKAFSCPAPSHLRGFRHHRDQGAPGQLGAESTLGFLSWLCCWPSEVPHSLGRQYGPSL